MSLLLHAADISHPGKPWRFHKKFADTILDEFFLQGDEEAKLGLPFSPLCDRHAVLIPESQIGFIEFIVEPSLSILSDLIDFFVKSDDGPNNNKSSGGGGGSVTAPSTPNPALLPKPKTQLKPFQTTCNSTRRTESEHNIKMDNSSSSPSSSSGNKLPLSSRTPSFPLQGSANHNYGPILRPWLNHLVENKAKCRMIASGKEDDIRRAILLILLFNFFLFQIPPQSNKFLSSLYPFFLSLLLSIPYISIWRYFAGDERWVCVLFVVGVLCLERFQIFIILVALTSCMEIEGKWVR
jgi:hypothetical protein